MSTARYSLVSNFPLFADVEPADCDLILASGRDKQYSRRETIFTEGDPVRHVIMLVSGLVKVTQTGPNGNEAILRLNGAGRDRGIVPNLHRLHSLLNLAGRSTVCGTDLGCADV